VLAEQHAFETRYRSCPRHQRLACPQALQAARGLKAGELRVAWQRVANPQDAPDRLGEPVVTVIVDGGGEALVGTAPAGATGVRFDTVPRGRDLAIAAALTRQGHVVSEVCRLRLRSTQTRTGDRTPSRRSSPPSVPATVTTTTTTDTSPATSTDTPPTTNTDTSPTTTPLPVVTGLAAAPASHSSMTLTWTAPGSTANRAQFRLQRCGNAGCTGTPTDIGPVSASTTSHTDSGLVRNTEYHFRIRAVAAPNSGYQDSDWSSPVSGRTAKEPLPQVTGLSLGNGLTWNPYTHMALASFEIQVCEDSTCETIIITRSVAVGETSADDSCGAGHVTCHFRIRAKAKAGSDYSDGPWK
jgi:hypothetical protein